MQRSHGNQPSRTDLLFELLDLLLQNHVDPLQLGLQLLNPLLQARQRLLIPLLNTELTETLPVNTSAHMYHVAKYTFKISLST